MKFSKNCQVEQFKLPLIPNKSHFTKFNAHQICYNMLHAFLILCTGHAHINFVDACFHELNDCAASHSGSIRIPTTVGWVLIVWINDCVFGLSGQIAYLIIVMVNSVPYNSIHARSLCDSFDCKL